MSPPSMPSARLQALIGGHRLASRPLRGPARGREDQQVRHHDGERVLEDSVCDPHERADHLHAGQEGGPREVRGDEHGRGRPSQGLDEGRTHRHHTTAPSRGRGGVSVMRSVLTLSHSCRVKPYVSKSRRISAVRQPETCCSMGRTMLNALSLSTVRLAMRARCLFSDTAMVNPSRLLTCSITWTSELPSPT